jgi:hypothetical protein
MDSDSIWQCAAEIPDEWCEGDRYGLHRLVEVLHHRRGAIRQLISGFRKSSRNPFPNWTSAPTLNGLSAIVRDEAVELG